MTLTLVHSIYFHIVHLRPKDASLYCTIYKYTIQKLLNARTLLHNLFLIGEIFASNSIRNTKTEAAKTLILFVLQSRAKSRLLTCPSAVALCGMPLFADCRNDIW
ncbi:hypothetical protein IscW_ISCW020975 [Ixodes scapularis]|uniref:Uncharacterized protein n=1 Tax=Ixodes scapularis TaxID=6945 RepID=B7Q8Z7_IXOSC|nr:hypothetical protein IscW_ISCW020975 [Ixodes scapularis]|eukprot:XP_002405500.1 hypothetical protein IscW_ISCW020975 [Ixodes scapularis]